MIKKRIKNIRANLNDIDVEMPVAIGSLILLLPQDLRSDAKDGRKVYLIIKCNYTLICILSVSFRV